MCGWFKLSSVIGSLFWYLQGALTPLIAGIAVWIAYQQWRTSADKVKFELFDRRFRVFEKARKILGLMYTSGVNDEQLLDFLTNTADVEFLFGPEIKAYREQIYRHVQSFISATQQMNASWQAPAGVRSKLSEAESKETAWAKAETRVTADKFRKYLDVSKL